MTQRLTFTRATCAFAAAMMSAAAFAQTTTAPANETTVKVTAPSPGATAASQPVPNATPEAITLLEKIQAKAPEIKTILADIRYDRTVQVTNDRQRRFGKLLYFPGPPAKFSITFDRLLVDKRVEQQNRSYIFDGQWLVEKIEDKKQFMKHQIVSPKAAAGSPDEADPLGNGRGPFIIPLTLKKDRVLARFNVSVVPNKPKDPEKTTQLLLIPKPETRSEYVEIRIWVSDETLVPVRVSTVGDSGNDSLIDLTDVKINDPAAPKAVNTEEPKGDDWQISITPYSEK